MVSVQDPSSLAKNPAGVVLTEDEIALVRSRLRGRPPQLALRSDGAWLLSVEDLPAGTDLSHRQVWPCVILTEPERALLEHRLGNAEAEVAARLVILVAKPNSTNDPGSTK